MIAAWWCSHALAPKPSRASCQVKTRVQEGQRTPPLEFVPGIDSVRWPARGRPIRGGDAAAPLKVVRLPPGVRSIGWAIRGGDAAARAAPAPGFRGGGVHPVAFTSSPRASICGHPDRPSAGRHDGRPWMDGHPPQRKLCTRPERRPSLAYAGGPGTTIGWMWTAAGWSA